MISMEDIDKPNITLNEDKIGAYKMPNINELTTP